VPLPPDFFTENWKYQCTRRSLTSLPHGRSSWVNFGINKANQNETPRPPLGSSTNMVLDKFLKKEF
jgi:hypothetical protein